MKTSMRAVWLLVMMLAGCGSSPSSAYYALAAVSGTIHQAALGTIEVRRPAVAGYLDRAEILTQWDGQRLQLAHYECWGEPLASMIGRVLAEDLTERLRGTIVFNASADLSLRAATVIELSLWKFDLGPDGAVHLDALAALRGAGEPTTHAIRLQARPVTTDTGAVVAVMSQLLGQLADQLATALIARGDSNISQAPKPELVQ
jgi:uncharacterized lipoprotein YmbA